MDIAAKFVGKIKNYPRKQLFFKLDHYKVCFIKNKLSDANNFF